MLGELETVTVDLKRILGYFFDEQSLRKFEEILLINNGKNLNHFLNKALMQGAVLSLFSLVFCVLLQLNYLYIMGILVAALLTPFFINYFIQGFIFENNKEKKERLVADLLLQASTFPYGTPVVKIIKYAGKADYGPLGREFEKAYLEIQKGASVVEALEGIKKRSKSRVVSRAANLLIQGYNSGADMGRIFKETADDILETNSILRERNAALIVEKYTLLFAGGIIVPAVLGLLVGMVTGMDFGILGELDFGISVAERQNILNSALLGTQIYIVEYAILASAFLALQEGRKTKALLYAAFLLPTSLLTYSLARGF